MTLTIPASATNPKTDPDWTFELFVPGQPRAKGSQIRKGPFLGERDIVMRWVATVSAYAIQERSRRIAKGDRSFPYAGNTQLRCVFIYDRPKTSSLTAPTAKNNYGDLDKLLRSIGDALSPGEFWLNREQVAKAAVIADDSLITEIIATKRFRDTRDDLPAGAYIWLSSV